MFASTQIFAQTACTSLVAGNCFDQKNKESCEAVYQSKGQSYDCYNGYLNADSPKKCREIGGKTEKDCDPHYGKCIPKCTCPELDNVQCLWDNNNFCYALGDQCSP